VYHEGPGIASEFRSHAPWLAAKIAIYHARIVAKACRAVT
jgi:hypothetical protein